MQALESELQGYMPTNMVHHSHSLEWEASKQYMLAFQLTYQYLYQYQILPLDLDGWVHIVSQCVVWIFWLGLH